VLALLGAVAVVVDAGIQPKAISEEHRSAAVGFEDMRRIYANLETNVQGLNIEQARVELTEADAKTQELASVSPLVEERARKKRIRAEERARKKRIRESVKREEGESE
jgi:hypothetical protein